MRRRHPHPFQNRLGKETERLRTAGEDDGLDTGRIGDEGEGFSSVIGER